MFLKDNSYFPLSKYKKLNWSYLTKHSQCFCSFSFSSMRYHHFLSYHHEAVSFHCSFNNLFLFLSQYLIMLKISSTAFMTLRHSYMHFLSCFRKAWKFYLRVSIFTYLSWDYFLLRTPPTKCKKKPIKHDYKNLFTLI